MRKNNNILIIIGVTIVAVGVIIAVIIASISNSGDSESSSDSEKPFVSSDLPYDNSGVTPPDNSEIPSTSVSEPISDTPSVVAEGIVATANSLIGVPFAENGADTNGFDNSGFIYYVLRENGYITCPRTTHEQTEMGAKLEYSQLKIGDLAFFSDEGIFGGIYIGGGKMIGCLMPGQSVRIIDITTDYYKSNFYCGISLS
ncbi:MAG: C40 family peptidase [Oscillospiraceae bacterium]|nr:C40 family peptidase [Oscillospiraceae bacterium]